jgi:hypothetical protein
VTCLTLESPIRGRASAAAASIERCVAEAYYGDQSPNSYLGISVGALKGIDAGIKLTNAHAETNATPNDGYCLSSQVGSWWGGVHGPGQPRSLSIPDSRGQPSNRTADRRHRSRMNTTLSPQQLRLAAMLGLLFVFVVGGGMYVLGQKQQTSTPAVSLPAHQTGTTAAPGATTGTPAAKPVAKPRTSAPRPVRIATHGLPLAVAKALLRHRVVVVSLVTPGVDVDTLARDEAAAAASAAQGGFVSLNVFRQANGAPLLKKLGVVEAPAVLVVMRPARIFAQLDGFADRDTVRQAVANARR